MGRIKFGVYKGDRGADHLYRTELIERLLCGTGGIRALLPCPQDVTENG